MDSEMLARAKVAQSLKEAGSLRVQSPKSAVPKECRPKGGRDDILVEDKCLV